MSSAEGDNEILIESQRVLISQRTATEAQRTDGEALANAQKVMAMLRSPDLPAGASAVSCHVANTYYRHKGEAGGKAYGSDRLGIARVY